MLHSKLFFVHGFSLALIINLSSASHSQKFLVTEIPSQLFTIDRINQEVYLVAAEKVNYLLQGYI